MCIYVVVLWRQSCCLQPIKEFKMRWTGRESQRRVFILFTTLKIYQVPLSPHTHSITIPWAQNTNFCACGHTHRPALWLCKLCRISRSSRFWSPLTKINWFWNKFSRKWNLDFVDCIEWKNSHSLRWMRDTRLRMHTAAGVRGLNRHCSAQRQFPAAPRAMHLSLALPGFAFHHQAQSSPLLLYF